MMRRAGGRVAAAVGRRHVNIGATVAELTEKLPHKSVVRFAKGNVKWARKDVDMQSTAAAAAMLDLGYAPGDTVVSLIPANQPEYHITQLACARVGLQFAAVPATVKPAALVDILLETEARAVMFNLANNGRSNLDLMRSVVPELEKFDDNIGVPFHSRLYKKLRDCIHTGYDNIDSFSRYKDILLYNRTYAFLMAQRAVSDDAPCFVQYDASGAKEPAVTHGQLLGHAAFPLGTAMVVRNEHIEI